MTTTIESTFAETEAVFVAPEGTCLGGCGTPMPPGQQCRDCAIAALDRWLARKRPKPVRDARGAA